jgi:hypothetical protein
MVVTWQALLESFDNTYCQNMALLELSMDAWSECNPTASNLTVEILSSHPLLSICSSSWPGQATIVYADPLPLWRSLIRRIRAPNYKACVRPLVLFLQATNSAPL